MNTNLIRVRVDEHDFLQQVMHDLYKEIFNLFWWRGGSQTFNDLSKRDFGMKPVFSGPHSPLVKNIRAHHSWEAPP